MFLAKSVWEKDFGDMSLEDLGEGILELLPSFLVVCAIICLACYIIVKIRGAENDALPIAGADATIIDMPRIGSNQIAITTWVMFETSDGRRMKLSCGANNHYVIGDKGYLRWQGTRLVSFELGKCKYESHGAVTQPQGRIPAWKQVEMEKQARQQGENN